MFKNKKTVLTLLLAILIGAFLARSINISTIPSGIYPDEAVNGTDALRANATGNYQLFYEDNNGREGLFINLQALSIKIFGNTIFALKLCSIIFGALTVLGIFLLAREIFQTDRAGLTGAYLTAFSYWAINFSRIGFRAIMVPFILSFAFYFIFKGIKTKKYSDFLIGGLIYGAGLHTYIAFRVSPLILIILLASFMLSQKKFLQTYWRHILIFAMAMFIAAAPMLIDFFITHKEHYTSRTSEISILNHEVNQGNLLPLLIRTFTLSLAKYFVWGDQNWRHNYPPYPILNPVTSISFGIGLIYLGIASLGMLWSRFKHGKQDKRLPIYLFLLCWLFALLIPEILASEGNPHALRSIGTLPAVMLIAVIPLEWFFSHIGRYGKGFAIAATSVVTVMLLFGGIFDIIKYHYFFANNPLQHQSFSANLTREAYYIRSLPAGSEKFVIAENMERVPIKFLTDGITNISYYHQNETDSIQPADASTMYVLMDSYREDIAAKLMIRFPSLKIETVQDRFGSTFYVLKNS